MTVLRPGGGQLLAMVLFVLSCFGLLLFLWSSFGGPVPLAPHSWRFQVEFREALLLSEQADVRISGVPVGRVADVVPEGGRTRATIELESKYAPLPSDARATLRIKTLLGETFVELTPGSADAPPLPEGGSLDPGRVAPTVELDEVLGALDPPTRADFQRFLGSWAVSMRGRGGDINAALDSAPGAVEESANLLALLDRRSAAVQGLVGDAGDVFAAIGSREAAARELVISADAVLDTTARRGPALRSTTQILPTFLRETRATLRAAEATGRRAEPVLGPLRPAVRELSPALSDLAALAPGLEGLFDDARGLRRAAKGGLPALEGVLEAAGPLLGELDRAGRDLVPVVDFLALYRTELVTAFAKLAAAAQAKDPATGRHYLRGVTPFTVDSTVGAATRSPGNRANPYHAPGALGDLATGLKAFDCRHAGESSTSPPCVVQTPMAFQGKRTAFPRVERDK